MKFIIVKKLTLLLKFQKVTLSYMDSPKIELRKAENSNKLVEAQQKKKGLDDFDDIGKIGAGDIEQVSKGKILTAF